MLNTMPLLCQVPRDRSKMTKLQKLLAINDPVVFKFKNKPSYDYNTVIENKPVTISIPFGFLTDGASSPVFSWTIGFRPDGVLAIGSYFHDFYYRHGFLLDDKGARIYEDRGKAFADQLLAQLTAEVADVETPGRIAQGVLALCGWPAWWGGSKFRKTKTIQLVGNYEEYA